MVMSRHNWQPGPKGKAGKIARPSPLLNRMVGAFNLNRFYRGGIQRSCRGGVQRISKIMEIKKILKMYTLPGFIEVIHEERTKYKSLYHSFY